MKQFKDPFEAAFEEQEQSPPDSPSPPDDPDAPTAPAPTPAAAAAAAAPAAASVAARNREEEKDMEVELGKLSPGGDPEKMAEMHCSPNLTGFPSSMTPSQASSDGQGSNQPLSGLNIHQHHSQPSTFPRFSDSLSWIEKLPQEDDNPPAPPAVESIHVPSTEPAHEAQPAREFNTAVTGSFDFSAASVNSGLENPPPENNAYPAGIDPGMLLFDFETSWNSVKAGVDSGLENPPPENNAYPAGIDPGMLLFDYETSWNSVTQS